MINVYLELVGHRSLGLVPRWRLALEVPFLAERSSLSICGLGVGSAFRNTTYHPSDYALPSGEFGIPLHHPRFLEWIGVPESAGLLEMGPGRWLHSLSQDQAMDAAIQLHRDVCLMATILDVLDQYSLSLQVTVVSGPGYGCGYPAASGRLFDGDESGRPGPVCPLVAGHSVKMLKLGLDSRGFPLAEVAAGALGTESAADGGHGSVATLIGSSSAVLRHLIMYDQTFLGRTLHCSWIIMDYGLSWPDFCVSM